MANPDDGEPRGDDGGWTVMLVGFAALVGAALGGLWGARDPGGGGMMSYLEPVFTILRWMAAGAVGGAVVGGLLVARSRRAKSKRE